MKDYGDKIPADKRKEIEDILAKLRDAHKREDLAEIDKLTAQLNSVFSQAAQNMYQQAGGTGSSQTGGGTTGGSQQGGGSNDNDVTDVDYEEVKD